MIKRRLEQSNMELDGPWTGGVKYQRAIWQFQMLFMRYGFKQALAMAEDFILWPDRRRPTLRLYHSYASDADDGRIDIPEKVEKAFYNRLNASLRSVAESVVRANGKAAVVYAEKAAAGELDERDAKVLVALNNGTGFVYREVIGETLKKENVAPAVQNIFLPFKEPQKPKRLPAGVKAAEAEYRVVEERRA